ncbi:MAG: 30S ribosomal protein S6 [Clostridiales bacterium]|jgi:small subunit ribosomal protein S6|nr:30S ribosomal protein S6 [Clostridiales bacterium]HAW16088.1 30S ribosomal protein S6 [Clostridiales bacterium]
MANKYQLVTVLNPAIGEEALNSLIDQIKSKVESGATIDALDNLGTKHLAYEIQDQKEGLYLKILYTAESEFPKEIERVLKITDGVLRFLNVRVSE